MKKCLVLLMVLLCVIPFSGCKGKSKVLLDTDVLKVEQDGAKIHVYDVEGGVTYTFIIRHKRPPERTAERTSVTKTEHIEILKCTKKIILKDLINDEFYTICIGKIFPVISVFKGGERI